MTEKKTKGRKKAKVAEVADPNLVIKGSEEIIGVAPPDKGPDYHITPTGEILLDSGGPIPEDHHVHPAHRALAAARKYCK